MLHGVNAVNINMTCQNVVARKKNKRKNTTQEFFAGLVICLKSMEIDPWVGYISL